MKRITIVALLAVAISATIYLLMRDSSLATDIYSPDEHARADREEEEEGARLQSALSERDKSPTPTPHDGTYASLELNTKTFLYFRVHDENGADTPGVRLSYVTGKPPDRRRGTIAGVKGWFALHRGRLRVPLHVKLAQVHHKNLDRSLAPVVMRDVNVTKLIVDVSLKGARVLRGRVLNSNGLAQPNLTVRPLCLALALSGLHAEGRLPSTQTDEQGHFELDGMPWLPVRVDIATGLSFMPTYTRDIDDLQTFCAVELPVGRSISFRVVDPDGDPVEKASIQAVSLSGTQRGLPQVRSDKDGRSVMRGLKPREAIQMTVRLIGGSFQPFTMDVVDPDLEHIDVQLKQGVALEGDVILPADMTSASIQVIATPGDGRRIMAAVSKALPEGVTHFRLDGLKPGPYQVIAAPRSGEPASAPVFVVAPADDVQIRLLPSLEIRGRVRGGGDLLVMWSDGKRHIGGFPGKNGEFHFKIPKDTAGTMYVRCGKTLRYALQALPPNRTEAIRMTLEEGIRLQGRVVHTDGSPIERAQVNIRSGTLWITATTNAAGEFASSGVPEGSYDISVLGSDGTPAVSAQVTAPSDSIVLEMP